jgi:ABC-type sugar transport system permease subunit
MDAALPAAIAARPRAAGAWRRAALPWLFLAPLVLPLALFVYWPLIHTAWLSFVRWNLQPGVPTEFVGLENYAGVLASSLFADAGWNSLVYVLAAIPLKVLLPLPVAVFIWSLAGAGGWYRTILFLPTLISFVIVAVVVGWMLNPIAGHVAAVISALGGGFGNPLASPDGAIVTVILLSAWKVFGFNVLLYLAGLAAIRRDLIEAMRLDGAGDWTILRRLIWPLLTPTTFFVLIATVIFSLQQVFTPIDILTEGGPENGTTNFFYMVYQLAFRTFDIGRGAAGTVLLFGLLLAITLIKLRVLEKRVHYQQ